MKPFLKWAGNKYQIIERIVAVLPPGTRLIEPFVGSGAVFLNTDYPHYILADANPDLINLYQQLKRGGQAFIEQCCAYFTPENNTTGAFYSLRMKFNLTTDRTEKAALFVYLNKHCYNGLCRYNAGGAYNVPFGRYAKPYFPAREMMAFLARAGRASFQHATFVETMQQAQVGDVVYCDPPYVPLSSTAKFTSYSATAFGAAEQAQLAAQAESLLARGIPVVISNHDTEVTRTVYQNASQQHYFPVQRFISCNGKNRNKVNEMLAVYR
ncbi:MAG: Dam family site-specific DNA-(adenine-N6)-methyltransferase [Caldilineaceae bacterium]|nr:Dam family site-specific DNA-(adenine-N6)-methyltransferase [Caldilineaceae bacterium]